MRSIQKNKIVSMMFVAIVLTIPVNINAAPELKDTLSGRILLQVESYGRAWYVNPSDKTRYYLRDGNEAYSLMRELSLGITNSDLAKIPTQKNQVSDTKLVARVAGKILLQVEEHGEAWYVDPKDGLRHYLRDGQAAYDIMRNLSLGITNVNLAKIPINDKQLVQDTTFADVAYTVLSNGQYVSGKNQNQILSPASMTKLMTALVLLDIQPPSTYKSVTITADHINYPVLQVGSDSTSEIDLKAGDTVSTYDLWVAMLIASSNQATIALVDNTGISRAEFIKAMNDKASQLGLTKTVFYEVTGLDAHNVTTPQEMATIAKNAFAQSIIMEIFSHKDYVIQTRQTPSRSINVLDRNYSLQKYGAEAAKVGYLIEAQRCVALIKDGNIVVIMHARSMAERNGILDGLGLK
ncbi:MAG: serine hydrolase [Candidatus Komeilibacteria bacterium]|nr:serine hydrolase [Candidatus Komeilibacteria bacterium]